MSAKQVINELREFVEFNYPVEPMNYEEDDYIAGQCHIFKKLEDKLTELEQKYCGKSVREQMEKHGLNVKDTNDIEVNVLCGKRFEEDMDNEPQTEGTIINKNEGSQK